MEKIISQMDPALIAVVLLMVVLSGFVLVILHNLASAAGVRIRADMHRLLEAYDRVIEGKAAEVRGLQEQCELLRGELAQEKLDAPSPLLREEREAPPHPSVPASVSYRAESFSGGYGAIRESFRLEEQERGEIVEQVAAATESMADGRGESAARLRREFSFDTVFQLSELESDVQLEVLDSTLEDRDWVLLRDYCELYSPQPFDITRFVTWLEEVAVLESDSIEIRSGDQQAEDSVYQARICEGVQIAVGNRLYDYSIDEREIS